MKKQFIVRKYIMAESASQAIRLEKKTPVHDVWVDEDWKKENPPAQPKIGYKDK